MGGREGPGEGRLPKRVSGGTGDGEAGRGFVSPRFYEEQRFGLPLWSLRLAIEVGGRSLKLRLSGLPGTLDERLSREIPFEEILRCKRREGLIISPFGFPDITKRPGVRGAAGRSGRPGRFYNLSSNRGVVLELRDGRIIVGSRRPEELERAILEGMERAGE